jgi:hypothetical protein
MPARPASRWLLNLVAFQAAWLASAVAAAHGLVWAGPAAVAAAVALHLGLAPRAGVEVRVLLVATLLGLVVEHGLLWSGLIGYPGDPAWVPVWMLALWPLFATTLNVCLSWFKTQLRLAAVFGGVAGPFAYWGGSALGAIELPEPAAALAALAIVWSLAFPGLLLVARHLDDAQP